MIRPVRLIIDGHLLDSSTQVSCYHNVIDLARHLDILADILSQGRCFAICRVSHRPAIDESGGIEQASILRGIGRRRIIFAYAGVAQVLGDRDALTDALELASRERSVTTQALVLLPGLDQEEGHVVQGRGLRQQKSQVG